MKVERVVAICCSLGAILIVFAICLEYIILPKLPAESIWSDEDAQAWMAASKDYHNKSFSRTIPQEELDASAVAFRQENDKLQAAKSRQSTILRVVHYSGVFFIAVGAGVHLYQKSKSPDG